ncbi:TonB-dependent receptor [Siphonobacter sp. BAB-5405]|uniref:TonB-dependent receptor family protein n=1 Tax=Siphonobacter sp. BAB-5405 TaxID=1864825 RepID=UPI000C7FF487|nr:TonB-dependent receptor [Siphonobacter sp. BAB-5405]PMD98240.1 TonB-dependent receptor [Siphonobacter sp. BAB-5405]
MRLALLFVGIPFFTWAQSDSLRTRNLNPVEIQSTRLNVAENRSPFAVSVLSQYRLQVGQPQLSLFDAMGAIPGVFAQNPDNFAQDLRISIRGFGARSSFGIRGLKVLLDGIPESTPDGQAKVNNFDVGSLGQLEVIRGASSALYGNASGGILSYTTETPTSNFAEAQAVAGSYGFQRYQIKVGQKWQRSSLLINASRNQQDGYREYAAMNNWLFNVKFQHELSATAKLTLLYNFAKNTAQDPGGLTMPQVEQNRRMARPQNVQFQAFSGATQHRTAVVYDQSLGTKHQVQARAFWTNRDFENRLAFQAGGNVQFVRNFTGGGASYQYTDQFGSVSYRLKAGVDLENQQDNRKRNDNQEGRSGAETLNQVETFRNIGAYLLQEFGFGKNVALTVGTRYDDIQLKVKDRFLNDADQSGRRTYQRFSPTAGLNWEYQPQRSVYANFSTSFETPALTELGNNPSNLGGFNPELGPMRAYNYELGTKATFGWLKVDAAVFQVNVRGEIVPYQLTEFPGRTFYRNAGNSRRRGVELGLTAEVTEGLTAFINYTYSNFKYLNYSTTSGTFDNNQLPGIPPHSGYAEVRYFRPAGFYGIVQFRRNGTFYADDANAVRTDAYSLLNLRLGWQIKRNNWSLEPFVGINNLLNQRYFANIQINAAGGRYFEPAMDRTFFGGVKVRLGK